MTINTLNSQTLCATDPYPSISNQASDEQLQVNTSTSKEQDSSPQSIWDKLDHFYCKVDKEKLNKMSYIPLVSTAGAALRLGLACIQAITGTVGFLYETPLSLLTLSKTHMKHSNTCEIHFIQASANISRCFLEVFPLGINNLALYLYDKSTDNKNGGLLPYPCQGKESQNEVMRMVL